VTVDVANTGSVAGQAVPQVYAVLPEGSSATPFRLVAFAKVALRPGQRATVSMTVDPHLLAVFDTKGDDWRLAGGVYTFRAGFSSADLPAATSLGLAKARLAP
jgi:beta-glucosidase